MQIDACRVGPIQTNCYLMYNDDTSILVDPGDEPAKVMRLLGGRVPDAIIITHHHHDHIGALPDVVKATGAPVYASRIDAAKIVNPDHPPFMDTSSYEPVEKVDVLLEDGDVFTVGSIELRAILTPGHTEGCVCIYDEADGVLFSGDTLFCGTHGRTDFPGGDYGQMVDSLKKLMELPDEVAVLPGHDSLSTIGAERTWIERL